MKSLYRYEPYRIHSIRLHAYKIVINIQYYQIIILYQLKTLGALHIDLI